MITPQLMGILARSGSYGENELDSMSISSIRSPSPVPPTRRPFRGWILPASLGAVSLIALGWHLVATSQIRATVSEVSTQRIQDAASVEIDINPITNLISIEVSFPSANPDDAFASLGQALGEALVQTLGPGLIERELNVLARERYDLYAMVIPYVVKVNVPTQDSTTTVAAARPTVTRRSASPPVRAQRGSPRPDSTIAYIRDHVSLENVRVGKGSNFGREVRAVFGTVINSGDLTLDRVRVRVYFLDDSGRRIGEKEFSPVLVSDFSLGDNTPLRPGYREDFGYNVEDDAPSGWGDDIEVEIIAIEFATGG